MPCSAAWHKRSALFRKYNHLQSVKKITLPHTRDFQLKLQYENDEQLPAGTPYVPRALRAVWVHGTGRLPHHGEPCVFVLCGCAALSLCRPT